MSLVYNKRIRTRVKKWFILYDLEDLQIGGHCGICGRWIEDEIMDKGYAWSLCENCMTGISPVTWWYKISRDDTTLRVGALESGTIVKAWGERFGEKESFQDFLNDVPGGGLDSLSPESGEKGGYTIYRDYNVFNTIGML